MGCPDLLKISRFLGVPSASSVQILCFVLDFCLPGGVGIPSTAMVLCSGGKLKIWLAKLTWLVVNRLGWLGLHKVKQGFFWR
jgi:hypothetical protein